jgi:hypothetical protein
MQRRENARHARTELTQQPRAYPIGIKPRGKGDNPGVELGEGGERCRSDLDVIM